MSGPEMKSFIAATLITIVTLPSAAPLFAAPAMATVQTTAIGGDSIVERRSHHCDTPAQILGNIRCHGI